MLELGCGSGRLAIPLAQAGYQVTGVDFSPAMLQLARAKAGAGKAGANLTLLEGDFSTLDLGGPYRLAIAAMNTFLHLLTQEEQLRALRHWRNHLAPGGLLLLDVLAPDIDELARLSGQAEYDKSWNDPDTGATIAKWVVRTVEPAEQILHVIMLYDELLADGKLISRTMVPFDLRYLWHAEAGLLLRLAGFTLEEVFGDWSLEPFDSGSERMILLARREEG